MFVKKYLMEGRSLAYRVTGRLTGRKQIELETTVYNSHLFHAC